jgi:hypothetical protein
MRLRLEPIGELQDGQSDNGSHHDHPNGAGPAAQNRPGKCHQPAEECRNEEQQDAPEPGQGTGLNQAEEQGQGQGDDDEPARHSLQRAQEGERSPLQTCAEW